DEVGGRQHRIVQIDTVDIATAIGLERRLYESGLTRTCISNQQRDRLRRQQAVLENAEDFALLRSEEEELRISRQLERELAKTEKLLIHCGVSGLQTPNHHDSNGNDEHGYTGRVDPALAPLALMLLPFRLHDRYQ